MQKEQQQQKQQKPQTATKNLLNFLTFHCFYTECECIGVLSVLFTGRQDTDRTRYYNIENKNRDKNFGWQAAHGFFRKQQ